MTRIGKGGIRPYSKKESTRKKPLMPLEILPKAIVLPLRSPCGGELRPVITVGDVVKRGELVAMPQNELGFSLYSGISGKVVAISHQPHPLFELCLSIVIKNDFQDSAVSHESFPDIESLSQEQVLTLLEERGLRSVDPDETPVHVKVMEGRGRVDTLIINACEAEPYLTADHRLLLERQDLIISGAKLLAYALGAVQIVVALQGDKLDAIEDLEENMNWDRESMRIRTLPTRYPFGNEKLLVSFVTGVEVPVGKGWHHAHCAVFSLATTYAVGNAIVRGEMQTHRAITVSGSGVKRPRNFWLPIGTSLKTALENAEGIRADDMALLLLGGPMTGVAQENLRAPILVGSPGLLAFGSRDIPPHLLKKEENTKRTPCIRCGHCLSVCPMHLMPLSIYKEMERDYPRKEELLSLGTLTCIGCGSCNFRCPSRLPLAQSINKGQFFCVDEVTVEKDIKIYAPSEKKESKGEGNGKWGNVFLSKKKRGKKP
ncbi:MAG: RnfABCDGE type electron transport complex subunit C [Eubacteriales bacterium]